MGWFGLTAQEEHYWKQFKSGDQVELVVEVAGGERHTTRVDEINNDMLSVQTPRVGPAVLEVKPKTPVEISIFKGGGVFKFKSDVLMQHWDTKQ